MVTFVVIILCAIIMFALAKIAQISMSLQSKSRMTGDLTSTEYSPYEGTLYDLDASPTSVFDGAPYLNSEDIFKSIAEGDAVDEAIEKALAEGNIDDLESANLDVTSGQINESLRESNSSVSPIGIGAPSGSFPNKLLANAALANTKNKLAKGKIAGNRSAAVVQNIKEKISSLARTSNSLVSRIKCSPLFITGGMIKITPTDLKMAGGFLAAVHRDWWITWPGLSVTKSMISAGTDIIFTFGTSAAEEIKRALPFIITFAAADLTRIREAEITCIATGKLQNGDTFTLRRTSLTLFTTPVEAMAQGSLFKTLMILFPFIVQKQYLYPSPVLLDDANPFVITISGVPSGVQVIARAASVDSDDWRSFKNMISLE